MTKVIRLYLFVALGLAVLHASLFAIVSPQFSHAADDWNYLILGERMVTQGNLFWNFQNRQFLTWQMAFVQIIAPNRYESIFYAHWIFLWLVSLQLFHFLRVMLPAYQGFAFVVASVYLIYVPFNQDYMVSVMFVSSWVLLLMMTSINSFIFSLQCSSRNLQLGAFGVSLITGFMAVRAYEAVIPIIFFAPFSALWLGKSLSKSSIILMVVWWGVVGIGVFLSAIPFFINSSEASYQLAKNEGQTISANTFLQEWQGFQSNAFPLETIMTTRLDYLLPSVVIAIMWGLAYYALKRQTDPENFQMLNSAQAVGGILMGWLLVNLGGLVFMVANLSYAWRAQMFAAIGCALFYVSFINLLANLSAYLLALQRTLIFGCLTLGLIFLGSHWFYHISQEWFNRASFADKADFWEEVIAFVPEIEDETFIWLYKCNQGEDPRFLGSSLYLHNSPSVYYIFGTEKGSQVQMFNLGYFPLTQDGLDFSFDYKENLYEGQYGYDEMIILTCENGKMKIVERWLADEYAPAGANIDQYNPYSRINETFIAPEHAQLLAP